MVKIFIFSAQDEKIEHCFVYNVREERNGLLYVKADAAC